MTEKKTSAIIVGGGHGGAEAAFSLRQAGWSGDITIISEEGHIPYHRPPLSKTALGDGPIPDSLWIRPRTEYEKAAIELRLNTRVDKIDREEKCVSLSDGTRLPYASLILATGARPRGLSDLDASRLSNVCYLRSLEDGQTLATKLAHGRRVGIIGAGYLGLEFAATACKAGAQVTVLETATRVLARVTSPVVSTFYENLHRAYGVNIRTAATIEGFRLNDRGDAIAAIRCADGTHIEVDTVVVAIGVTPSVSLAQEAGLHCENGIVTNEAGHTSDPAIHALGDCANFYNRFYGKHLRIESVPNAIEQARIVTATICGKPPPPASPPWFWSDQYGVKLQTVGFAIGFDAFVTRGSPDGRGFSVYYLSGDTITAADLINRPPELVHAKRIVANKMRIPRNLLADDALPMKEVIERSQAAVACGTP